MSQNIKRQPNFTEVDKKLLLELIKDYPVIESKALGGETLSKKKNAWENVTRNFNSQSMVQRGAKGLRQLYENMKRGAKKELANENKEKYRLQLEDVLCEPFTSEEADNLRRTYISNEKENKIEMKKTGGGTFSVHQNAEQDLVLSLGDNIRPISCPYDSAALYFDDIENVMITDLAIPDITYFPHQPETPQRQTQQPETPQPETPQPETQPDPSDPEPESPQRPKRRISKKISLHKMSVKELKKLYIIKKIRNEEMKADEYKKKAQLEKRSIILDMKHKQKSNEMDIEIKKRQLELLRKESENV